MEETYETTENMSFVMVDMSNGLRLKALDHETMSFLDLFSTAWAREESLAPIEEDAANEMATNIATHLRGSDNVGSLGTSTPKKRGRKKKSRGQQSVNKSKDTSLEGNTLDIAYLFEKEGDQENHVDGSNDEALRTWQVGKQVGMLSNNEEVVITTLRRSQRK